MEHTAEQAHLRELATGGLQGGHLAARRKPGVNELLREHSARSSRVGHVAGHIWPGSLHRQVSKPQCDGDTIVEQPPGRTAKRRTWLLHARLQHVRMQRKNTYENMECHHLALKLRRESNLACGRGG